MNKPLYYKLLFFLVLMQPIVALDILTFPTIQENNKIDIFFKWLPKKLATHYTILSKSKKDTQYQTIATISSITDKGEILSLLKNKIVLYQKEFGAQNTSILLDIITGKQPNFINKLLYYSYYDTDIAKIIGNEYHYLQKNQDEYDYLVIAYNNNTEIDRGQIHNTTIFTMPPPKDIQLYSQDSSLRVSWKEDQKDGVLGYNIYAKKDKEDTFIKMNKNIVTIFSTDTKTPSNNGHFVIDHLENNTPYHIKISTVYINHIESSFSQTLVAIPAKQDIKVPTLEITQNNLSVVMRWTPITNQDVYYNLYTSVTPLNGYSKINTVPVPSSSNEYIHRMDSVEGNTTYWYMLEVVNSNGIKQRGDAQFIKIKFTNPPATPRIVSIHPTDNTLELMVESEVKPERYQILRSIDSIHFQNIADTTENIYKDTNLNSNITYCYKVVSIDSYLNLSKSSNIECSKPLDHSSPSAPMNVFLYNSDHGFILEWQPVQSTSIVAYNIYQKIKNELKFTKVASLSYKQLRWSFDSTIENSQYTYYVTSVSNAGIESEPSLEVSTLSNSVYVDKVSNVRVLRKEKGGYWITWDKITKDKLTFSIIASKLEKDKYISYTIAQQITTNQYMWNTVEPGAYKISVIAQKGSVSSIPSDEISLVVK